VISPYAYFRSIDEYAATDEGIVSKAGDVYQHSSELTRRYHEGEIKSYKEIGRIKGSGFFETIFFGGWVYTLRDYDDKEAIVIKYIMHDDDYVFIKK
jgi:hypothetical protein